MNKLDRDFKGIWISKEVWLSEDLSLMEKVLFVEIHSLDNERGCFASNRYFAEFFNFSTRQIATYIASLKDKGFITVTILNQNERTIRAAGKYSRASEEAWRRLKENKDALTRSLSGDNGRGGRKRTS